jgi:hypothetical protein
MNTPIYTQRTISAMVGKGSASHNSRKFKAENVNGERTYLNMDYCNEPIKKVYHMLFDQALEKYNAKQKRPDRRIENYYEKIRTGKQEKLFHELILQIGNRDDNPSGSKEGIEVVKILHEYYQGFQKRNPNLYVFSAHMHLDEATPHLHIDFVPFVTGSKRGLETRVSLKQALAAQGFHGGSKGYTEWDQWVQSEKEELAVIMERNGIAWEQKGSHEKHLTVLDYKKQEREKEIQELDRIIDEQNRQCMEAYDKTGELAERFKNLQEGKVDLDKLKKDLSEPRFRLEDPPALMSARTYKANFAEPVVKALKKIAKALLIRYITMRDELKKSLMAYHALERDCSSAEEKNSQYQEEIQDLKEKNRSLEREVGDYRFLRKVFGDEKIDNLIYNAEAIQAERERERNREKQLERSRRREYEIER